MVSYTTVSPLPLPAVCFLLRLPKIALSGRYPALCPVKPGLSSPYQRICSDSLPNSKLKNKRVFLNSFPGEMIALLFICIRLANSLTQTAYRLLGGSSGSSLHGLRNSAEFFGFGSVNAANMSERKSFFLNSEKYLS